MTTKITADNIEQATLDNLGSGPIIANVQIANSSYVLLDDTAVNTDGGYIIINGSKFESNVNVLIDGTAATSVTYVSENQIRAQVGSATAGSKIVYLVNTDTGATAIRINGLTYSGVPSWSTDSTLTTGAAGEEISIQLSATADSNVSYQLQTGSTLPTGLSLAANGLLSGTITGITEETLYNFTIEAIDEENQDSPRSFSITITIGDANINSVVLALNADNNTFITDASTNSFAITPNGDTRPSAFSPYNTNWSNYFDGTGDYLTIASSSSFALPGDFTMECWIYPLNQIKRFPLCFGLSALGSIQYDHETAVDKISFATGSTRIAASTTQPANAWYHVAVVRNGSTITLYINGTNVATTTSSTSFGNSSVDIGGNDAVSSELAYAGYVSNARLVPGTAIYTSDFTPSTSPLTAISGTSLLTCQSNRLIDNSTNNFTITGSGNASVSPFSPFAETDTTTGSGYFDGTGDYLLVPASNNFVFDAGDFTIEAWINPRTTSVERGIVNNWQGGGAFIFRILSSNKLQLTFTSAASGVSTVNLTATDTITPNAWSHVAVVRNGNSLYFYVNGVVDSGGPLSMTQTMYYYNGGAKDLKIGTSGDTGSLFQGHISNLRIVKGSAVYTSNFTPPTSPLTAISGTSLLTLQSRIGYNNSQPVDESGVKNIITRNGNASVGSYTPHTPAGWSAYFDGSSSLTYAANPISTSQSNFTIEAWVYPTANPTFGGGVGQVVVDASGTAGGSYWGFGLTTSRNVVWRWYDGGSAFNATSVGIVTLNTWSHIAVSVTSNSIKLFINGTLQSITGTSTLTNRGGNIGSVNIGRYATTDSFYGYISNVRLIVGTGLYISNFTPSTTPPEPVANTSLLTLRGPSFSDDGPNRFAITRNGDTRITPFSPFKTHTIVPDSHSVYFDGTDDHFTIADNVDLRLESGNFTAEGWFYPTKAGSPVCFYTKGVNTTGGIILGVSTSVILLRHTGQTDTYASVSISGWNHIAWVRNGNTISIFVNGVAQTVVNSTVSFNQNDTTTAYIGSGTNIASATNRYGGYASNFRIVKGTALYTSNFTPSTTPLTKTSQGATASEVELLTCQSSTITDNSDNNFTLTVVNQPQPSKFNPFGETVTTGVQYSPASHGGSYYFDGTGDSLQTPATNQFAPAGQFTIECFIYLESLATDRAIIGNYTSIASTDWLIDISPTGVLRAFTNGNTLRISSASGAVTVGQWHHVALTRNSSNVISMFLDGVIIGTYSQSGTFGSASKLITIGSRPDASKPWFGYISNLSMIDGTALYTSAFVPPAAPPSPVAGTTLLLNGTNAGIADGIGKNVLETVGNARIINGIKKYGTGSMYFDGTGDGLLAKTPAMRSFGTGDFTIECWMNTTASGGTADLFGQLDSGSTFEPALIRNAGTLYWQTNYGATNLMNAATSGLFDGNWHHVAMVRYDGVSRVYLDGTSIMNANDTTNYNSVGDIGIGAIGATYGDYLGYIDDFRISYGVARYTSNFSPPTSSFQLK